MIIVLCIVKQHCQGKIVKSEADNLWTKILNYAKGPFKYDIGGLGGLGASQILIFADRGVGERGQQNTAIYVDFFYVLG